MIKQMEVLLRLPLGLVMELDQWKTERYCSRTALIRDILMTAVQQHNDRKKGLLIKEEA